MTMDAQINAKIIVLQTKPILQNLQFALCMQMKFIQQNLEVVLNMNKMVKMITIPYLYWTQTFQVHQSHRHQLLCPDSV